MQVYTPAYAKALMGQAMKDWRLLSTSSLLSPEQTAFHLFEDAGLADRLEVAIPEKLARLLQEPKALELAIRYLYPSPPFTSGIRQLIASGTEQLDEYEAIKIHYYARMAVIQRDRVQCAMTMIGRNLPRYRRGDNAGRSLRLRFRTLRRALTCSDARMRKHLEVFAPAAGLAREMRRRSAPRRIDRRREWWLFTLSKLGQ